MSPERKMPSEGREILNHRAILLVVVVAAIGAAVVVGLLAFQQKPSSPPQSQVLNQTSMSQPRGGHLYMQTNETRNAIVHYRWSEKGTLTEVERVATGGAGSGLLSPIYHTKRPNQFEGAGSVILSPDRGFLFTTNGGAKTLAYDPSSSTLFVLHTFGPDHLRLMSVDAKGKLTARREQYW